MLYSLKKPNRFICVSACLLAPGYLGSLLPTSCMKRWECVFVRALARLLCERFSLGEDRGIKKVEIACGAPQSTTQ